MYGFGMLVKSMLVRKDASKEWASKDSDATKGGTLKQVEAHTHTHSKKNK